ncbi:potassium-transporting ATPase subunit KdpA [Clostridium uliginosum]|uniref:Potassium-transporting ATPase potassium-binding subunit n=1 Tax=Clostridium uliginosum TaxID=119641 RepID=A0A1I1L0Z1_9CLOT|nr:potassium-transporting ATPase subunit KdpA [Clostridium uliginosum]SFC64063.1 K+-transporting ATPase ATPase A chain [Clostridium uliginosum]
MKWVSLAVLIVVFVLISIYVGKYMYSILFRTKSFVDPVMDKIDNAIYKVVGIEKKEMNWKEYLKSLITTNIVMLVLGFILLMVQQFIVGATNPLLDMNWHTAFNTTISFMTNTNLQDYTGELNLTNISQMIVITFMMFTSAATGFAVCGAFIKGITGHSLGNFYMDLVRIITRLLLPVSIIASTIMIWQGVPQTLGAHRVVKTLEGGTQTLAYGPVAALESIKHLGTNGGGFFGANSSHPFENPTAITNMLEILLMMFTPGAYFYVFGKAAKNKKHGVAMFSAALFLFLMVIPVIYHSELAGNATMNNAGIANVLGNMEGKEVRFGVVDSSLFSVVTTAFTTGSVNNMHDSLTPIGGAVPMWNMMLNLVFGGKGVGFMNLIVYAMLSVFICGLMVGRTPEFLRRKIEGREMKLIAATILIHPILILLPTGLAAATGQASLDGYHGFSEMLYQFCTSAANNGSGFEGLADGTMFWNVSAGLVMFLGRYTSMILLLALAGSMKAKTQVPESSVAFRTDKPLFVGVLIAIIIIIGALTFFPALVLGPGAEFLTIS